MIQKEVLTRSGYSVVGETNSVDQVIELFHELSPNIVILGFHPSKFDGIKALKALKSINVNANVVMCSSYCAHSEVIQAISLGVKDWIPSLSYPERLLEGIKKALRTL